jgi:hypothetical protein
LSAVSDTPHTPSSFALRARNCSGVPPASSFVGVGHEPQSLSDVRRADAASWQYGRPAGVALALQVSENSVEPAVLDCACNLLAKDCCRVALRDKPEPGGPQVALVGRTPSLPGSGERLTGAGAGPGGNVVHDAGKPERAAPATDAGEEVALRIASQIDRLDLADIPCIDIPRGDQLPRDQVAQPVRAVRIVLVVIGVHGLANVREI